MHITMLAPRKTLWSTPDAVIDIAIGWIPRPLRSTDRICDVGCGDGRVLLQWASRHVLSEDTVICPTFVGIDVDPDRIRTAQQRLQEYRSQGHIRPEVCVKFYCQNALESPTLWQDATILFLYLIPRGLRILQKHLQMMKSLEFVVTYMSPLPEATPVKRELVTVPHQPGAAWPLFLYDMREKEGTVASSSRSQHENISLS